MKKTALLLAALCACALAKDYEYALESTSQKIYEEPTLSYVTRQIYDAKAHKTQVVTESELKDGGKNRYKEVSYFGKDGELVKFYAYDYDFKAEKWRKINEYKASLKNGVSTQETTGYVLGVKNASKTVSKRANGVYEETGYELKAGKWQKSSLARATYNRSGQNELTVYSVWDGAKWQPKEKMLYLYDANEQPIGYERSLFENGAWVPSQKEIIAGDVRGKYERVSSVYVDGAWQNSQMSRHEAANGKDVTITSVWDNEKKEWKNSYKDVIVVSGADFETAAFSWDNEKKEWKQEFSSRNVYDKSGERLLTQRYGAKDGDKKLVYGYDARGDNVSIDVYELVSDANGKGWAQKERIEATFDSDILAEDVVYGGSLMSFDMQSKYAMTAYKRYVFAGGKSKLAQEREWRYKRLK